MLRLIGLIHLLSEAVLADYCESNWCNDETEYCCGKNKCCDKTLDLWFLWAVILMVIFVLAVIVIYRKIKSSNKYNPYQLIPRDTGEATAT